MQCYRGRACGGGSDLDNMEAMGKRVITYRERDEITG